MAITVHLLPAVTLALLCCFPAAMSSRRDVLELGDADFDYLATEHETMLVKFYAPWCGHCKKLAPEFEKAATRLKGTVQLAKVDCTAHLETCGRFGVSGYPTLKIFRNGRDSGPYDGPRTADGIYHYMKKQTGPDSVHLKTEENLQTFINHYDASIVGVFSGADSAHLLEFLKAAGLLREQFRFAHITDLKLGAEYGLDSEGVLLFRPPRLANKFEESVVIFTDYLTIGSLRRFIRDHIYGLCPHMTLENRDRLRVRDLLTAYYDLDYQHNPRGSNYWRNRVMKAASKYTGRGLTFSVANKKDFLSELEDDFGLGTSDGGELPFVTIRTKLGHKYTMREEFTRDGQSLERFLDDYFTRQLKRYIKSEPIPERNTAAVKVVVAESFDDIVNDPERDVLIQFYSPSCPHCKKLEPVYRELADTLNSDPNIVIAKMNVVDNDVPLGYDVQGYPTIYFAPVGKKDEPIRYEGGRELKDFLKFLKHENLPGRRCPALAVKMLGQQVLVLNQNIKRESGRKVQTGNINAAKTIADVIRTCLGPRAMMKMLLDPTGGIVMTNDGNAILREIQVQHPAAKSMIEISRTQDEEVGDGTTSVIILAGEMLAVAEHFLEQQMHPTVIISAYRQALEDMLDTLKEISSPVDTSDRSMMLKIVHSAINTKALSRWSELACNIALDAVRTVELEDNGRKEIDIKKYAKVEKVPGGIIEDSCVLKGVMVNKDVTHPRMKRMIREPRIVLLDCSLEYKKGESQTDIEISKEEDFARILQMEEEYIQQICEDIIRLKPDLVFTEKGISDLAQHYLMKANISAIRRVRKTDNNRIARACGARIVSRTDELREEDVGTGAGLFEVKKIGDEYFTFVTECKDPKACTILLRGASKEILAEVERNLQDAMQVCRNVLLDPFLLPGGGAVEMAVSKRLTERSRALTGIEQWPYRAVAQALEVIPRTLIQNCGASTIRVLTSLRAKHTQDNSVCWGVDGETGCLSDMSSLGIWEPLAVKAQTYKTAVETAILLLRIDDIVSGHKKKDKEEPMGGRGAE